MLVLGQINISKKDDKKKIKRYLTTFSMFYIRQVFKSRHYDEQIKVKRLMNTQTYLQNTYKTNKSIYNLILDILKHINITSNGIIYTSKEQINTIKVDQIFNLVTFGNLNLQRNAIFYEALRYAINATRMMLKYGC